MFLAEILSVSFQCGRGQLPRFPFLNPRYTAGRVSVVCIATRYGLDGPGIVPLGERFSAPVQTDPGAHPVSCTVGTG